MISISVATAIAAAILSTSFISGIFGMAGGMILMGILLAALPLAPAMVMHGLVQMAANGWRAWQWRSNIHWRVVGHYALGAAATTAAVALLHATAGRGTALIIIGLSPFVGLVLPARFAPDLSRRGHDYGCGAICTLLQLLAGVSGPILDVFFVRSNFDRKQLVATKAAVQLLGHFLKVAYFGHLLASGGESISPIAVILAIPLAIAGTHLSRFVLDVMTEAQFRSWSRYVIGTVSTVYLVQGLVLL
jgi:uncharacterized membrane protein YfcA